MVDQLQGFPNITAPMVEARTGVINQVWLQFLRALWNRTGAQQGGASIQTGVVLAFCGSTAPDGYVECNGDAVSRLNFATLFAVIGTTYGAGDGSTTFNVPDFRARDIRGAGGGISQGQTGGASSVTIEIPNLPAHNHEVTDPGHVHTITDPGHLHTDGAPASNVTAGVAAGGRTTGNTGSATTGITINSATTGITTQNTGSGTALTVQNPYGVAMYIIKT